MATQKGTQQVWRLLVPEALVELGSVTALCGPGSLALCRSTLQSACAEGGMEIQSSVWEVISGLLNT